MPGRVYVGLSRSEKYQGQFEPQPLAEGPSIGRVRVIVGLIAGFVVLLIGYLVHHPEIVNPKCTRPHSKCSLESGGGLPMIVWLGLGVLLATSVIVWPYLSFAIKSRKRGSEHE